jgi:hypothetical protein
VTKAAHETSTEIEHRSLLYLECIENIYVDRVYKAATRKPGTSALLSDVYHSE